MALQHNIVQVIEYEVSISAEGVSPNKKIVPEGEQIKKYAEYDIDRKFRSLYVDHGLVAGSRRWLSPLDFNGFNTEPDTEIGLANACCEAIKIEASKQGIAL